MQTHDLGAVITNQIQLSPHYGTLSAYFNRGILATQATAKALNDDTTSGSMADKLDGISTFPTTRCGWISKAN